MRCYWLCLLLLVSCNWAEETTVSIKNDGSHEWTLHISANGNEMNQQPVKNIYQVLRRTRLDVHLEANSISSMDIKMEQNNGAFWFEGRVTKNELSGQECITPTTFQYSRQPFPIRVEICNNTIHLIPVGSIINICIDNRTPDEWTLWNVFEANTLRNEVVYGGTKRCHVIKQYYSGGNFDIRLERVNYPSALIYFPGLSRYDEQPPCRSPYFSNNTFDHSFMARFCNNTMILTTLNQQVSKLDGFCIENQSNQKLYHRFAIQNGDFSLSFTEGLLPRNFSTPSQVGSCFRLYGYHDRNVTFNINATYESPVVKGQFIRVSEALSECTLPGTLVSTWENPPVEWYQCGNVLTVIPINHPFCIDNASPDSWTVTKVWKESDLEESEDDWYPGGGPASVITSKVVNAGSRACYELNKRHNRDEPFNLILERLDGKSLTLSVQHTGLESEEKWGPSKLLANSNWEEEIPYKLELYKNTLFLDSALDRKVKVCIDNRSSKTWTVAKVFGFCERRWGIQQNPRRVLLNEKVVEGTRSCYFLNLRDPHASFSGRMQQDGSEEWFEARVTIKATETDEKCLTPENLNYSSEAFPIKAIVCKNTLILLPTLLSGASRLSYHSTTLHDGPMPHCDQEGKFRPIPKSCDQHEECHQGRWVIRENPKGMVMVAEDGTFASKSHVNGC